MTRGIVASLMLGEIIFLLEVIFRDEMIFLPEVIVLLLIDLEIMIPEV
jgi:hypothetical protein